MLDFAEARTAMVNGQILTQDVTDPRILDAFLEVPRELFVPGARRPLAYLDRDVPVDSSSRPVRCLLKPMVLAKLVQAAAVGEQDRVLQVGCATGYGSAILSRLAHTVIALEESPALAQSARENLAAVDAGNVTVVEGALAAGWPDSARYDVILIEGATEFEPEFLLPQLKTGGRAVCVLGSGPLGKATVYRSVGDEVSGRPIFDAAAPLLPGFAGKPQFVF